ncbi:MAG: SoxR reducing system RseC family protein [Nitrospirota bacterium]|nr:SoxR reducing system RseC family protein [Nitrospirota bacterium]
MEETGTVIETRPGSATVRLVKNAACGSCSQSGACHPGDAESARVLTVRDPLGVHSGQEVAVHLPDGGIWLALGLMYGFPLAMLFAGAAMGWSLAGGSAGGSRAELASALAAGVFLVAGFLLLRILRPLYERRASLQPEIVRVTGGGSMDVLPRRVEVNR